MGVYGNRLSDHCYSGGLVTCNAEDSTAFEDMNAMRFTHMEVSDRDRVEGKGTKNVPVTSYFGLSVGTAVVSATHGILVHYFYDHVHLKVFGECEKFQT